MEFHVFETEPLMLRTYCMVRLGGAIDKQRPGKFPESSNLKLDFSQASLSNLSFVDACDVYGEGAARSCAGGVPWLGTVPRLISFLHLLD